MSDVSERFLAAISALEDVADEVSPEEARGSFDDTTLQEFWRDWPHISGWTGALWRLLSRDLEVPATPVDADDHIEIGEGG